jgi:ParB/RepB/Spo0J family partition protein
MTAKTLTYISLMMDMIDEDPNNLRATKPTPEEDDALRVSLETVGLLQPIIVRLNPDDDTRVMIVAGARRFRAARALEWQTIQGYIVRDATDADAVAMQATENAQRAAMHPIDVWRAMVAMQERGATLALAAQCLGITERRAQQLDKLGRIAPPLIEAMRRTGIPSERYLSIIALATPAAQIRAFNAHGGKSKHVDWWQIQCALCETRISRQTAIFNLDAAPDVTWQLDVFAEPGSPDEWTTTDKDAFLRHQQAALEADTAARVKKGQALLLAEFDPQTGGMRIPAGYKRTFDTPRGFKLKAGDERKLLRCVDTGHRQGAILELWVEKVGAKKPTKDAAAGEDAADTPAEAPVEALRITKDGLHAVAAAKTQAIRDRLAKPQRKLLSQELLMLLCVAICGENVSINPSPISQFARLRLAPMLRRVLDHEGRIDGNLDFNAIARDLISNITVVGATNLGSGPVAEAIGAYLAAEGAFGRFDTEDFLKTLRLPALIEVRDALELPAKLKTGSAIRAAMVGKFPDWRPPEAVFTPDPEAIPPAEDDDDAEHGDAQAEAA